MTHGREFDQPAVYQVRIKGTLNEAWSDWFEGLAIHPQANDETLLIGPVVDQIALHGLLSRLRDLGLTLLAVLRLETTSGQDSHGFQDIEDAR